MSNDITMLSGVERESGYESRGESGCPVDLLSSDGRCGFNREHCWYVDGQGRKGIGTDHCPVAPVVRRIVDGQIVL